MSVRVSVVVAVYNTGEHIEPLIASLDRQTLPSDEFEVIFVDDGSTDDTPARLDELAASRANVTVVHEPNSGWPGRPRNLGIDRAAGRYVLFVDHDDWLGDEALARMTDYADAHESDILIGRYAGHRRGVAKVLFDRSRPDATLANAPLLDSLTPHKLFRTEFLRTHGLRFPEGRRRLEDHVFVVRAYFLAKHIAVYADYHCYFHIGRTDEGNAGFQRIEPDSYYGYVREVIAIIEEFTAEDPALRSRCLRRPLRQEVLSRLDGKAFLAQDVEYQHTLFDAARNVVLDTMPTDVDSGLPPRQQLRAYLLREGRFEDLIAYTQHQVGVHATAELRDLRWREGAIVVEFECRLLGADGTPWACRRDASGTFLTVPQLTAPVPASVLECEQSLTKAGPGLVARRREDSEEWRVGVESSSTVRCEGDRTWTEFRAIATLDPQRLAAGQPLTPGVWDIYAVASQTGWSKQARLGSTRTQSATQGCRPALLGSFAVVPYWTTPYGNLSVDVAASAKTLVSHATPDVGDVRVDGAHRKRELVVRVPLVAAADAKWPAQVRLDRLDRAKSRMLPASTRPGPDGEVELSAALPRLRGQWAVFVQPGFAAWRKPARTRVMLSFARSGVVSVAAQPPATTTNTGPVGAARLVRGARRRLGRLRRKLSTRA